MFDLLQYKIKRREKYKNAASKGAWPLENINYRKVIWSTNMPRQQHISSPAGTALSASHLHHISQITMADKSGMTETPVGCWGNPNGNCCPLMCASASHVPTSWEISLLQRGLANRLKGWSVKSISLSNNASLQPERHHKLNSPSSSPKVTSHCSTSIHDWINDSMVNKTNGHYTMWCYKLLIGYYRDSWHQIELCST